MTRDDIEKIIRDLAADASNMVTSALSQPGARIDLAEWKAMMDAATDRVWKLVSLTLQAAPPDAGHPLIPVLRLCATTFRAYETLHNAKGTLEGFEKAVADEYLAQQCEKALAEALGKREPFKGNAYTIEDLALCPACGAGNVWVRPWHDARRQVECHICRCSSPVMCSDEDVLRAWNNMPRRVSVEQVFELADAARTAHLRDVDCNDQMGALGAALEAAGYPRMPQ